jgi:acetyl-CoA carboxylase biotin carboxyl carrier protein
MSDTDKQMTSPEREMIESVWAEAREMVRRLEGSSVQRFVVAAGDYRIEIERGAIAPPPAMPEDDESALPDGKRLAKGRVSGPGDPPGGRLASGVFSLEQPADDRIPVLAPLVGTFYRAPQPGAKPFVEIGDAVEQGQTVCIVEAMKMMNEIVAGESGKVAEIALQNGDWVEFDQPLMYLEPEA